MKEPENNEYIDDFIIAETSEEEKKEILSMTGNKKVWNYFLDLLRDKRFQGSISSIRKYTLNKNGEPKNKEKFRKVIKNLCRNFGLDEMFWADELEVYVLKNQLPKENLSTPCIIFDRIEMGEDEYPDGEYEDDYDDWSKPKEPVELEPWSYSHPVIIRVSPYASQREIIDYIKKTYSRRIKSIQERYQNEDVYLGKVKKKKKGVQERNDFIYQNRHLPSREIMKLLYDKYEGIDIDYGYIGKIISMEKKKREN
jgi:hypothetical protein